MVLSIVPKQCHSIHTMPKQKLYTKYVVTELQKFEQNEGEPTRSTIEALRVGTIHDRNIEFTLPMLMSYVNNFHGKVYNGADLPVNLNHQRGSDAAGWITDVYVSNNALMVTVEWTELGIEKISKKLHKYVSVEIAESIKHWETGEMYEHVLCGMALTTDPALGGQDSIQLSRILYHNNNDMDLFRIYVNGLLAKNFASQGERTMLSSMFSALPEDQKEEAKEEVAKVEALPEEVKEEEKEETKEEETPVVTSATADLAKVHNARMIELEKEVQLLKSEKRLTALNSALEKVTLSATSRRGFADGALNDVKTFMSTLNEKQIEAFTAIIGKYQVVAGEVGTEVNHDSANAYNAEEIKKYAKDHGLSFKDASIAIAML